MKYQRVANESEKHLLQEVYTNKAPFENPVIPEVSEQNVDEAVDNSLIVWRGCGQLSSYLFQTKREKERFISSTKRKSYLTFERK